MAVHDIDVDQIGAAFFGGRDGRAQLGKIRRQNRGRNTGRFYRSTADLQRNRIACGDLKTRGRELAKYDTCGHPRETAARRLP